MVGFFFFDTQKMMGMEKIFSLLALFLKMKKDSLSTDEFFFSCFIHQYPIKLTLRLRGNFSFSQ
jgi:hypothetical protein